MSGPTDNPYTMYRRIKVYPYMNIEQANKQIRDLEARLAEAVDLLGNLPNPYSSAKANREARNLWLERRRALLQVKKT